MDALVASVQRASLKDDTKLMLFATTPRGRRVVAKCVDSFGADNLVYEAAVYADVVKGIMARGECANLVTRAGWLRQQRLYPWYDGLVATVAQQDEVGDVLDVLQEFRLNLVREYEDAARVDVLVTVQPPNLVGSLHDHFDDLGDDWRVAFQMAYTLTVCAAAGLSHNDGHLGNWLVSTGMPAVYYAVSATRVVPVAGVRVWLYDWDNAYAEALGDNPQLDQERCDTYGMCNSVSELHDLAMMACNLQRTRDETCRSPTPPTSLGMWDVLAQDVCASRSKYPCHVPQAGLAAPRGVTTALDYALANPFIARQGVDVQALAPALAAQLVDGAAQLVAHARIDRGALMAGLQARAGRESVPVAMPAPKRRRVRAL
jgi:hypothetical protein